MPSPFPHLADTVELRTLTPDDEPALAALFLANDVPAVTGFFDPFPLTPESAHAVTHHRGRDLYWGILRDRLLVGLFMVRGWDAGHEHRAIGIVVDRDHRAAKLAERAGTLAFEQLRARGETSVRARVHEDNVRVRKSASNLGFVEVERGGGRLVLEFDLTAPVPS